MVWTGSYNKCKAVGKVYRDFLYAFLFFLKVKPNSYNYRNDKKFEQIGFGGIDEKSILKKLRNRDEKAFEEIIDLYSAYVTAIARNLLSSKGTKEHVEEVVADTFIALWNTAERINYEEYSSIKAYIAVIARNKAKDWLRAAKAEFTVDGGCPYH